VNPQQRRVGVIAVDGGGQGARIAWRHQDAVAVEDAAGAGLGRDHRHARGHALQDHVGHGVVHRRQHDDAGIGQERRQLVAPELPCERHLGFDPERPAPMLEAGPRRPVAGDGQSELWAAGSQAMHGLEKVAHALALDQPAGEDHRRIDTIRPRAEELRINPVG
jgi:hypothetical protein